MSGIYIPDVGLPQDGDFELWISIKKDGSYNYNISGRWNEGKRKAIPVPPHGRLIDADELYEDCVLDNDYEVMATTTRINEYIQLKIDNAPTIIMAETPKEET